MSSAALKSAATGGEVVDAKDKKPTTLTQLMADPRTKAQIALALPKHMTADRLARIAMTELRKTPKLMQCDQMSFLGAIMQCAQLGLEPGGALGHAYLLPFERRQKQGNQWVTVATEAQLIIGYRGMIDLARRSGQIVSLSARAVHENDTFSYAYGLEEKLEHVPCEDGNPGSITHVYAVARLKDGGVQFEVMSKAAVDKVRALSKSSDKGPWVDHYEEMAKKTAIRRLFKYLPVSIEMQRAVNIDEKAEVDIPQDNASVITGEYSVVDEDISDMQTAHAEVAE
ncbi:recombination protein RecT [Atlantibacter subterranea]|uniref:Recombination protein RecT n=1 Tax=Atlantibacter subterraneus TaxID=255519 RepID=A0A3R9G897_9ENTR|nr:recombination protein RecT [Atlantibacter subterranea]RSB59087.1 recombination protein RecT [Atlantibacter subterranea]RSE03702.1 recombination protein RecT [Atlantibacter subterranea]RSE24910.1 recombination protein RecT [Atlantibacter subterranea]